MVVTTPGSTRGRRSPSFAAGVGRQKAASGVSLGLTPETPETGYGTVMGKMFRFTQTESPKAFRARIW
jgi:hypothetical protein